LLTLVDVLTNMNNTFVCCCFFSVN